MDILQDLADLSLQDARVPMGLERGRGIGDDLVRRDLRSVALAVARNDPDQVELAVADLPGGHITPPVGGAVWLKGALGGGEPSSKTDSCGVVKSLRVLPPWISSSGYWAVARAVAGESRMGTARKGLSLGAHLE